MAAKAKEKAVAPAEKEAKKTKKTAEKVVKVAVKKEKVVKAEKPVAKKSAKTSAKSKEVKAEVIKAEEVKEVKSPKKISVSKSDTTAEELFEAGAHFGHVVKKWNPKMNKYLWGAKNGIHIFDLEKTVAGLEEASKTLTELASEGKRIVLVGTKRQVRPLLEVEAKRLGVPYITQRWMGGLITNWRQIKQTLDRLSSLKQKKESGQLKKYTKKEQLMFDKEIARLERVVGGISALKEAPEAIVVFDTHKERLAVKEAYSRGVKVIGLVDSNANPDVVDIVVPMNDDSAKGLEIVVRVLGQALENGLKARKEVTK